jgi:hypothetical protein
LGSFSNGLTWDRRSEDVLKKNIQQHLYVLVHPLPASDPVPLCRPRSGTFRPACRSLNIPAPSYPKGAFCQKRKMEGEISRIKFPYIPSSPSLLSYARVVEEVVILKFYGSKKCARTFDPRCSTTSRKLLACRHGSGPLSVS